MANIKRVFGSIQSFTVTNLHSLSNSPTGGWQSAAVDNQTDLYLDALVQVVLDFANTAPANSKAAFVYAYSGGSDSVYTNPASGSEGAITLPDITSNPLSLRLIGVIPYVTQDEVVESAHFSVAAAFGGVLPPKWGIVIVNHAGAALAGSGNTVKWTPVYASA